MQIELLEPRRCECAALAMGHAARAEKFARAADCMVARGWASLSADYRRLSRDHEAEAQALADYAFLLDLAKVDA